MKVDSMDTSERQVRVCGKGTDMLNPVRKLEWGFKPHPHYDIFTPSKRQGFLSNGVNTGRVTTTTLAALVILSGLVLVLGGCTITLGGYEHQDLSNSIHKSTVLQQAKELASSSKPENWRTAAKNYGSLGMLDEMDECIRKYVEKEPEAGRSLIYTGEQIHKFYEGKRK